MVELLFVRGDASVQLLQLAACGIVGTFGGAHLADGIRAGGEEGADSLGGGLLGRCGLPWLLGLRVGGGGAFVPGVRGARRRLRALGVHGRHGTRAVDDLEAAGERVRVIAYLLVLLAGEESGKRARIGFAAFGRYIGCGGYGIVLAGDGVRLIVGSLRRFIHRCSNDRVSVPMIRQLAGHIPARERRMCAR